MTEIPHSLPLRLSAITTSTFDDALLAHVSSMLGHTCGDYAMSHPAIAGLECVSWYCANGAQDDAGVASIEATASELREQGLISAVLTGDIATFGPQMIVTDVDSTFIRGEVIDMLAGLAGTGEAVQAATERAMRGDIDFAQSLAQRVATLEGAPATIIDRVRESIEFTEGAEAAVRIAHDHSCAFMLVSGGFSEVVEPLVTPLGIDAVRANGLEVADGRLTGRTRGPIIDRAAKAEAVRTWARERSIPLERVLVAGDGANDVSMMAIAGHSVAFCAKPAVRSAADTPVNVPRLDVLIALVGWDAIPAA